MKCNVQALFPVEKMMRGVALPAPPPDSSIYRPGQLNISLTAVEPSPLGGKATRLSLLMQLPSPGWGSLNVTGPVVGWSFAEENPEVGAPHALVTDLVLTSFGGQKDTEIIRDVV